MRYNSKERLGVVESDLIFTREIGWIFREQPIVDIGIDALIETAENGNPQGNFIAAQIKTGIGNFFEKKVSLTLYISNIHYHYWTNLDLPIILIAHIEKERYTCWENLNKETIIKTKKGWKLEIPKSKLLCKDSKKDLQKILLKSKPDSFLKLYFGNEPISESKIKEILTCSEDIQRATNATYRSVEILQKTNMELKKKNKEILRYAKLGITAESKKGRALLNSLSILINNSSKELNKEINSFAKYFSKGFGAYEKLSIIYFEVVKNYSTRWFLAVCSLSEYLCFAKELL